MKIGGIMKGKEDRDEESFGVERMGVNHAT